MRDPLVVGEYTPAYEKAAGEWTPACAFLNKNKFINYPLRKINCTIIICQVLGRV